MSAPNKLEAAVLDKLLTGELPSLECLREQCRRMCVAKREFTGVGFYTEFEHPVDVVRLPVSKNIRFGDVFADIDGLTHGAGFVLYIDNGLITMLEGYTIANETWPDQVQLLKLSYFAAERDLTVFRAGDNP